MTSSDDTFGRIAEYYNRLVAEHGNSHKSCDYGTKWSQQAKFRVISEVMPLDGVTILDVGCGLAEFAQYLDVRFKDFRYFGIDISPEMIRMASTLHPELDLSVGNILEENPGRYDVVTANGIFYLLGDVADDLSRKIIHRMYGLARCAVAFNSLSVWAADKEEGEYYADPLAIVEYCRQITPWVVLRHDYHLRDFTIYMYREKTE